MSRPGERSMVPTGEFQSYYGRPVIKPPVWKSPDVPAYFFLGGLAGTSSLMAAVADTRGLRRLARVGRMAGAVGALGSVGALIHDLGRPERFLNMLRVARPTSPLSMGSWVLALYGPLSAAAAGSDVTGWFPRLGKVAGAGAAAIGPVLSTYTAVLVADTAVPAWHEGRRHLPFLFAGSSLASAGGLGILTVPVARAGPARRLAVLGVALDLGAATAMERQLGLVGEPYGEGRPGRLLRAAKVLGVAGGVGALAGGRSRALSAAAGLSLLASAAGTRFGVFEAGMASARDPKYTVVPQRERLEAGTAGRQAEADYARTSNG